MYKVGEIIFSPDERIRLEKHNYLFRVFQGLWLTNQTLGFPGHSEGKVYAHSVGDLGSIPGSGRYIKGESFLFLDSDPTTMPSYGRFIYSTWFTSETHSPCYVYACPMQLQKVTQSAWSPYEPSAILPILQMVELSQRLRPRHCLNNQPRHSVW